ncbi:hypothetical protein [Streptomyces violaceorubidus]|uniref:hypothetical protein n=1 Tax=Streptomyces violaceorubidus TaxID=284042 RepID=UPI00068C3563|nr:hypothetical protein [Streptomyces violaceorubidus]
MRPDPHAAARRGARLRVLVLLLALLVPCTHVTGEAAPVTVAGGTAGEYDHLDSALRVAGRSGRRPTVVRPAPPSFAADPPLRFDARSGRAAALPRGPRSLVLRC